MSSLLTMIKERLVAVVITFCVTACGTGVTTYFKVQSLEQKLDETVLTVARHEEDSRKLAEMNGTMKAVLEELRQLREDIRADRTRAK